MSPNELVIKHLDMVDALARMRVVKLPASVQLDELKAAGYLGLVKASRRFGERGIQFSTYASQRIIGEMIDSVRRPGCRGKNKAYGAKYPTYALSLSDDGTWGNAEAIAADVTDEVENEDWWACLMNGLEERERYCSVEYFRRGQTMKEIGKGRGWSKAWVSILLKRGMAKMRKKLESDNL